MNEIAVPTASHISWIPWALKNLLLPICAFLIFSSAHVLGGPVSADVVLTNVSQVCRSDDSVPRSTYPLRLAGTVLWVSPERDSLILQDDSGGLGVRKDIRHQLDIIPGTKILVEGNCEVDGKEIAPGMVIDNDGIHTMQERTGEIFLGAGLHPISVEWFNSLGAFGLEVECSGPQMPRQKIPDSLLFRTDDSAQTTNGLTYSCYEGEWGWLPDFQQLEASKKAWSTNFDLEGRTRDINVGMVFSGYFKAKLPGKYSFWLTSDDGSKLCIEPFHVSVVGKSTFPVPEQLTGGMPVSEAREYQWAEIQGIVTRVSQAYDSTSIEISSDGGLAYLKVTGVKECFKLLLHSRIRAMGVSQNVSDVRGQKLPSLLVPDFNHIEIIELASEHWTDYPITSLLSLHAGSFTNEVGTIIHVAGKVVTNMAAGPFCITDETNQVLVDTAQAAPGIGTDIEAMGVWSQEGPNFVLRSGSYRGISSASRDIPGGLPLLSKAIQVKSLNRVESQRGYPVRIEGIVTARVGTCFMIQDSTWSVYCYWTGRAAREEPMIGDYWKVEGKSCIDFAPSIEVSHATFLRHGILPEPLHPNRDELMNGSLDTQYVEIQGIATDSDPGNLRILTRDGEVALQVWEVDTNLLKDCEGGLVRIRGVSSPLRDTNQMMLLPRIASLRLFNAAVILDERAPSQPFEIGLRHVSDLLRFDVRADALRRIKIAGQVLHERGGKYFLLDQGKGLRFEPKTGVGLHVGDFVEVVGFPDLSGPSPVLREAVARLRDKGTLPPPKRIPDSALLNENLDSTLVCIKARLIGASKDYNDQILELQTGTRNFVARLANVRGVIPGLLSGSILEVTGIYASLGGNLASNRGMDTFEILLNSQSDIRVLAKPSWWTFRHTSIVLTCMLLAMLAGTGWITQLHYLVRQRTLQLASEIKNRERAEYRRALEEERARIASDLHDELGATLTEIRFLGAVKSRDLSVPKATRSRLMEVSEKSRQMVSSLDEIVWAVNPANDSVPNLARYLCHVAEEFFRTTGVQCRLDVDPSLPKLTLTSESRHNIYLVVREAMNNIVKHSKATEAWLRICWEQGALHIILEDNGCGFSATKGGGNGLCNMRRRLEKVGGEFELTSQLNAGTKCLISLPLNQNEYEH